MESPNSTALIPANCYMPARRLIEMGYNYSALKTASQVGGSLVRWKSKKTHRVYYKNRTPQLF